MRLYDQKALILAEHLADVRRRLRAAEADTALLKAKESRFTWLIAMNEVFGDRS